MRARIKRRQRNRRILIVAIFVLLIAAFAIGAYFLSLPSKLDAFDNKPVSSSDISALNFVANQPYGTGVSSSTQTTLDGEIKNITGQSLISGGKPIILYIGEEGCPYCAEMRWALNLALMRFGNFTSLSYMTSAYDLTDFPTFTYVGSTYTSKYIVFQPYEILDRGTTTLQTPPGNYTSIFNQYSVSQGVPFVDFGGPYYVPSALIPSSANPIGYLSSLFGSSTWGQVISNIGTSDPLGALIKAGANVITATICKSIVADGGTPPSLCQQGALSQLAPIGQSLPLATTYAYTDVTRRTARS